MNTTTSHLTWKWRTFEDLTLFELYDLLNLRQEVFIVEQSCVYPDLDFKDQNALHLLGKLNNQLVGYIRLLPENIPYPNAISFGRVVTSPFVRGKGVGKLAIAETLLYLNNQNNRLPIIISAQLYLKNFYESFGFQVISDTYDEDGIPHIKMRLEPICDQQK